MTSFTSTVTTTRCQGLGPQGQSYVSYASFNDPDGNQWVLQRYGAYEPTAPKHHWSFWYAAYVVARERGRTPDEAARNATLHIEGALVAQA